MMLGAFPYNVKLPWLPVVSLFEYEKSGAELLLPVLIYLMPVLSIPLDRKSSSIFVAY